MTPGFTEKELATIARWAEHEERTAPSTMCDQADRARRIKAKVSAALAQWPTVQPEKTPTPDYPPWL